MSGKAESIAAADVMQRDVIVVYDRDTLQDAMALMTENHVTGLPVVNSAGKCVGVITVTDILNFEQEHAEYSADVNDDMALHYDADSGRWENVRVSSYALEQFGEARVEEVMATTLIYVGPDAPLKEVAKKMCDERVHRVVVLSEDNRLLGIITSSDFTALYANG